MTGRLARPHVCSAAGILLAALGLSGCAGAVTSAHPSIHLDSERQPHAIEVRGLPPEALSRLSSRPLTDEEWSALLRVTVAAATDASSVMPAVAGRYAVDGRALRFTPTFPLDPGRQYSVRFDPSRLSAGVALGGPIDAIVALPAAVRHPSTVVARVYPSGEILPANQLRIYLHFSAPMGLRGGIEHVRLLDDRGMEVADPFLPIESDYWNEDRTRYTIFFDPGRVKRGILPNRQMGRALHAGRRYTLVVDAAWRDGNGQPLAADFRHEFTAGKAVDTPLSTSSWSMASPRAGTREPFVVGFPAPLDHGLLQRAVWIWRRGESLPGETRIEGGERRWLFVPRDPWQAGEHHLVVLSILEDLAGNRIGRAFEVDEFERTDRASQPERFSLPFSVRPATTP